jgi:hypothetical protein
MSIIPGFVGGLMGWGAVWFSAGGCDTQPTKRTRAIARRKNLMLMNAK